MNKITELKENFCWKSKTKSVWQENPDLLDRVIARIHSEATVYDAIIRSKNRSIPTNEKIFKTIKFLEENSFWRSNPFSLVSSSEHDTDLLRTTSKLQKKCIRDIWDDSNTITTRSTTPPLNNDPKIYISNSDSETCKKTDKKGSVALESIKAESPSIEEQSNIKKIVIVKTKSVDSRKNNNILNDYNYEGGSSFSRTYAEAVRGSSQGLIAPQTTKSQKTAVWD